MYFFYCQLLQTGLRDRTGKKKERERGREKNRGEKRWWEGERKKMFCFMFFAISYLDGQS